jgi:hypothetical protein
VGNRSADFGSGTPHKELSMIVTLDDCDYAMRRLAGTPAQDGAEVAEQMLPAVRVVDGDGQFRLTASLPPPPRPDVTVDLAAGALKISCGRVSRWVPLPPDALFDHAVVQTSEDSLTVSMPTRERRACRHLVYVW